ncbi:MAG TPA: MraY family glycosyltransferase [Myxococcota bacterium]|nr:MraY family glycosyltransferase [Myxococcota bacterium]
MQILGTLIPFATAGIVAAFSTPIVSRAASALRVVDRPNERKVNRRENIPLLGGIAVALGLFVGLATGVLLSNGLPVRGHLEGLLLGGLLLMGVGAFDDRFSLNAPPKFAVQIAAAAIAIYYGFRIDQITDPLSRTMWFMPPWLAWGVTTLWIVGVTNALNLIDGLDGLATGVAAIIGATLTLICWQINQPVGVLMGVALVGALLGFLPFNFSPARIFLGDTGALFIGYVLSLLAIEGYAKASLLTFVVPMLALAVPIMDTMLSILRRVRRRARVFSADRLHMHHRLLESEGSQRAAVLSLYFLTACFCVIALSFTKLEGVAAILFLVMVLGLTYRLLRNLGLFDGGTEDAGDQGPPPGASGRR